MLVRFAGIAGSTLERIRSLLPRGVTEAGDEDGSRRSEENVLIAAGAELARAREGAGDCRVVALSECESAEACREAVRAGAHDWLALDWSDAIIAARLELIAARFGPPSSRGSTPGRMHVLSSETAGDGLVLRSVCRALEADRGFIAEVREAPGGQASLRIMENLGWIRDPSEVEGYGRHMAEYPLPGAWLERLHAGEPITGTWATDGDESRRHSALVLPILVEHRLEGVLGFTDGRVTREWREEHRRLARTVAASVATILEQEALKAAARQSHEDYHELFLNANDIVYTHDLTGRFMSVNRAGQKLFGYTADELTRMSIEDVVDPAEMPGVRKMIAAKLSNGDTRTTYRVKCRARDGRELQVETSTRIIMRDGQPAGIHGIARDVTAQVEIERKLAWHAAIMEESPYAIIGRDLDGTIVSWNRAAEQLYGFTAEEAIGQGAELLAPPDEGTRAIGSAIRRSSRAGAPISQELRRRTKSGEVITVDLSISAVHDAAGNVIGAAGISRDITAEKKAAGEITRLAAIIESSHEAITSRDREGRIVSWNGGAARMYGYGAEEAIGQTTAFLEPEETRGELDRILQILLAGGRLEDHESVRMTKDGRRLDVSLSLFPVRDATGEIVSVPASRETSPSRSGSSRRLPRVKSGTA